MGIYREKICKVCGIVYRTSNENYCSRKCMGKNMVKERHEADCSTCGKHFVSKLPKVHYLDTGHALPTYCSTACRIAGQTKGKIASPCKTCGKVRMLYPSDVKLGRGNYCSKKCAGQGNSGFRAATLVTFTCKQCGTTFTRERWRFKGDNHTGDFCSQKCHFKAIENPLAPLPLRQQKAYQRLRVELLKLQPACVKCGSKERLEMDHIVPIALAPQRFDDPTNVQMLCWACHQIKTKEDMRYISFLRS